MKRAIAFMTAFLLVFIMVGCKRGKPKLTSDQVYEYGLSALETVDDFLDGSIDTEVASARLDSAKMSIDEVIDREEKDLEANALAGTAFSNDAAISHYVSMVIHEIAQKDYGVGKTSDILSMRNKLANCLNQKKR